MLLQRLNDNEARTLNCHAELVSASRRSRNKFGMTFVYPFLFLLLFLAPGAVLAAPATIPLPNPLGTTNILDLGARLIQAGLGIAGSLALLFFIYGGFLWLTSGGSPDKIKKGRDVFLWSVVGLVIIFSSYMMVDFVIKALTKSQTNVQSDACVTAAKSTMEGCYAVCEGKPTVAEADKCAEGCNTDYDKNMANCKK